MNMKLIIHLISFNSFFFHLNGNLYKHLVIYLYKYIIKKIKNKGDNMLIILDENEMKVYETLTNFGIAENIILLHMVETEEVEVINENELGDEEEIVDDENDTN